MQPTITVRRTAEADWRQVRALRLEMLADTPIAFGETLESAQRATEPYWRERARRGESRTGISIAAMDAASDDRWIATMGGYLDPTAGPMLVGVYVSPQYRGTAAGVTDHLLLLIEQWAAHASASSRPSPAVRDAAPDASHSATPDSAPTLALRVHCDNLRAIAAYSKRGYLPTGRQFPYPLNPREREMEMRKTLLDAPQ